MWQCWLDVVVVVIVHKLHLHVWQCSCNLCRRCFSTINWRTYSTCICGVSGIRYQVSGIRYQVTGNLISPGEPLAIGYFVAPSKEKKIYRIKLIVKVKLINKIMQESNEN